MVKVTVSVTPIPEKSALLMCWERRVDRDDLRAAFQTITNTLNKSRRPLYVIVDLKNDPVLPVAETITAAYWGPFRHPLLAEWLVVGSSQAARTISRTLVGMSRRDNMRWFQTMEQAEEYLANALVSQAS